MEHTCDNCRYPGDETAGICRVCVPETMSNWQPEDKVCDKCHGKGYLKPQRVTAFERKRLRDIQED